MSGELAAFLLVLALGFVPVLVRPRAVATWLGALVALGGALGFLSFIVDRSDPASEVGRWVVLLGAAGLLHLIAVVAGRREAAPVDRRALAAPVFLYGSSFLIWLALELVSDAGWARSVPTWAFLAACAIGLVVVPLRSARGPFDAPMAVVPGLALLCGLGVGRALWPETVTPAILLSGLAVLGAGIAWMNVGSTVRRGAVGSQKRTASPGDGTSSDLGDLLRELARADTPDAVVATVRVAAGRRGMQLMGVVAGRADAPLVEVASPPGREPLSVDPADPLYVALRGGLLVANDEVDLQGVPVPARAAVHRLDALGAHAATPLSVGQRLVGGILVTSEGVLQPAVLQWLALLGAPVGLALESLEARAALDRAEAREASAPIPVGVGDGPAHAHGIVGASEAIRAVIEQIERVAPTDAAVFIRGETGTGKERVVEAIHGLSGRAQHALVKIPCAALPEPLLESELFGYEPGAFTGAVDRKEGRFEVADGGTLFFDDVDTLPSGVQAKLLRALQEGEVQRLGSNQVRRVDVRIVAATNRDLAADVSAGTFREDLYYRLNVVPILLPALRERKEDIPLLIEHFLETDGKRLGCEVDGIAADSLADLEAYEWPGNVRELRNVIERALVMNDGAVLRVAPPVPVEPGPGIDEKDGLGRASLPELLRRYKTRLVTRALELSGGNQRQAAEMLGIHRPSLTRMVRELGLRDVAAKKSSRKTGKSRRATE